MVGHSGTPCIWFLVGPSDLVCSSMQSSSDVETRILSTALEALCSRVYSTSCDVSKDGGLVGSSGRVGYGGSSRGVEAHARGAEGRAGGGIIGRADSRASGGEDDRCGGASSEPFCNCSKRALSF